jgi:hypothetical protein
MQDHRPGWAEAHRAPGARTGDPDQVWSTCEVPWPSAEGYRMVWVHDSGKQLRDAAARARKIEKGVHAIGEDMAGRLSSPFALQPLDKPCWVHIQSIRSEISRNRPTPCRNHLNQSSGEISRA